MALTALVTPEVCVLVLAFTSATTDEEAVATVAFVFALTALVPAAMAFESVVVAFSISLCVARLPSPRIAATTSETSVPKDESVRDEYVQTKLGRFVIMLPIELEAAVIAELVFAFTTAAIEVDAVVTRESVFALMLETALAT